jgi:hypothetical protein
LGLVDTIRKVRLSSGQSHGQACPTQLARFASSSFFSGATMVKRRVRQNQHEAEATLAETPTQKRALADALRHLGPNASAAALARFVKEQFGMELTFCMLVQKAGTARTSGVRQVPRRQYA